MNMSGDLIDEILNFVHKHGINLTYVVTVLCIIITISYFRNKKKWSSVEPFWKPLFIGTLFATVVMIVLSILELTSGQE